MTWGELAWLFFARLVVGYGLLMAPWPKLADGYRSAFIGTVNYFCADADNGGLFHSGALVKLLPNDQQDSGHDTLIILARILKTDDGTSYLGPPAIPTSVRHLGYIPLAAFLALVFALPMRWKRRLVMLLWGLILVHAFIVIRLAAVVAIQFEGTNPFSLFDLGPTGTTMLSWTADFLAVVPVVSFLVPMAIWLILVRLDDSIGTAPVEHDGDTVDRIRR